MDGTPELRDALVESLYGSERAARRVLAAVLATTGRPEDADDALQDAVVAALVHRPATDRPLGPWLATVARRRAIDCARRTGGDTELPDLAAPEPEPRGDADLGQALGALTEAQLAAFVLRELFDASVEEAAARLGTSVASVKNLHLRARAVVREPGGGDPKALLERSLLGRGDWKETGRFPAWFAGDPATRLALLDRLLEVAERQSDATLAGRALWSRGAMRGRHGQLARALQDLERAEDLLTEPHALAGVALTRGVVHATSGGLERAREALDEAVRGLRRARNPRAEAMALAHRGWVQTESGDLRAAGEDLERAVVLAGSDHARGVAEQHLGNLRFLQGRLDEAVTRAESALALARRADDRQNEAGAHANLAMALGDQGRHDDAARHMEDALGCIRRAGNDKEEAVLRANLGVVLLRAGRVADGRVELMRGLRGSRAVGDRRSVAIALANLAVAAVVAGEPRATAHLRRALPAAEAVGMRRLVLFVEAHLGASERRSGEPGVALDRATEGLAAEPDPRLERMVAVLEAGTRGVAVDPDAEVFAEAAIAARIPLIRR